MVTSDVPCSLLMCYQRGKKKAAAVTSCQVQIPSALTKGHLIEMKVTEKVSDDLGWNSKHFRSVYPTLFPQWVSWRSLNCFLKTLVLVLSEGLWESHTLLFWRLGFLIFPPGCPHYPECLWKSTLESFESTSPCISFVPSFLPFPLVMRKSNYCGNNHDLWAAGTIVTYLLLGIGPKGREPTSERQRQWKKDCLNSCLALTGHDLTNY